MESNTQSTKKESEGEWFDLGPNTNLLNIGNPSKEPKSNPKDLLSNCSLLANSMYSMHNTIKNKINLIFIIQILCILLICASLTFVILQSNIIKNIYNKQTEISTS